MRTVPLATHAGITVRYLEMAEAGINAPTLPTLRKLAVSGVTVLPAGPPPHR